MIKFDMSGFNTHVEEADRSAKESKSTLIRAEKPKTSNGEKGQWSLFDQKIKDVCHRCMFDVALDNVDDLLKERFINNIRSDVHGNENFSAQIEFALKGLKLHKRYSNDRFKRLLAVNDLFLIGTSVLLKGVSSDQKSQVKERIKQIIEYNIAEKKSSNNPPHRDFQGAHSSESTCKSSNEPIAQLFDCKTKKLEDAHTIPAPGNFNMKPYCGVKKEINPSDLEVIESTRETYEAAEMQELEGIINSVNGFVEKNGYIAHRKLVESKFGRIYAHFTSKNSDQSSINERINALFKITMRAAAETNHVYHLLNAQDLITESDLTVFDGKKCSYKKAIGDGLLKNIDDDVADSENSIFFVAQGLQPYLSAVKDKLHELHENNALKTGERSFIACIKEITVENFYEGLLRVEPLLELAVDIELESTEAGFADQIEVAFAKGEGASITQVKIRKPEPKIQTETPHSEYDASAYDEDTIDLFG